MTTKEVFLELHDDTHNQFLQENVSPLFLHNK